MLTRNVKKRRTRADSLKTVKSRKTGNEQNEQRKPLQDRSNLNDTRQSLITDSFRCKRKRKHEMTSLPQTNKYARLSTDSKSKDNIDKQRCQLKDTESVLVNPCKSNDTNRIEVKNNKLQQDQRNTISEVDRLSSNDSDSLLKSNRSEVDHSKGELRSPNEDFDYASDIFQYMKSREGKFTISSDYMSEVQKDISPKMREILVNWMVEIQESFKLKHETLYLAVKLVDLYLQKVAISRKSLQLVGAASYFLAAKFDETGTNQPLADDLVFLCNGAYDKKQLIDMERNIFSTVGFDINAPNSYRFLRRYAKCGKVSMKTLTLARFILELSLMQYKFVDRKASELAAACLWVAMKINRLVAEWSSVLVDHSSYQEQDIQPLCQDLIKMLKVSNNSTNAVHRKYSDPVYYSVAKIRVQEDANIFKISK